MRLQNVSPEQARVTPGLPVSPMPVRAGVMVVHTVAAATGEAAHLLERALVEAGLEPARVLRVALGPRLWASLDSCEPRLVVAVGQPVAEALLGRTVRLSLERGRLIGFGVGRRLLLTESPGAVLGLSDAVARGREYRRLVNDLLHAVPYGRRPGRA